MCFPTSCAASPAQQAERACALCSNFKNAGERPAVQKSACVASSAQGLSSHSPLITGFLIANLEFEFGLTHTKLSTLKISNHKYFAVSYSDLLLRWEEFGRPTTSDPVVVATKSRDSACHGSTRAFGHKLRIACCGRPSLCCVAEERQESERDQRDRAGFGRVDRVGAHSCENGVTGTIGQSPIVAVGSEAGAIPKFAGERTVIQNREAVAYRIESILKRDCEQRARIEGESSGDIEQSIRGRALDDFVEHASGSLLEVSIHRERAGSAARTGRHDSLHQHVAVDHARAAELAAFDIHDGAAGCGERAIHSGVAGGLRVIGARGKDARAGYFHGARIRKFSRVVERARVHEMSARSVVENAFVAKSAEIIDVSAGRIVDRACIVERAGEAVRNCSAGAVVDHAGVGEKARGTAGDVDCAAIVERARVGDRDGAKVSAAIVQGDRAILVVVQCAGVRKAAGIEDQAQADRAGVVERAGIGEAAGVESRCDADRAFIVECALIEKAQAVSRDRAGINKRSASAVDEAGVIEERNCGLIRESSGIGEVRESSADRAVVGKLSPKIVSERTCAQSDRAIVDKVSAGTVDKRSRVRYLAADYDRTIVCELAEIRDRAGAVEQKAINQALASAEGQTRARVDIQSIAVGQLKAVRIPISVELDGAGAVQDAGVRGGRGSAAGPIATEIPKAISAILPGGGRSAQAAALRPQLPRTKEHGHHEHREDNEGRARNSEAVVGAGSSNFDEGNLHVFLRWKRVANASQARAS